MACFSLRTFALGILCSPPLDSRENRRVRKRKTVPARRREDRADLSDDRQSSAGFTGEAHLLSLERDNYYIQVPAVCQYSNIFLFGGTSPGGLRSASRCSA